MHNEYHTVLWDIGGVIVELQSIREGYAAFIDDLTDQHGFDFESAFDQWKTTLGTHFKGREGSQYRLARDGYEKATAELFDGEPPTDWPKRLETALVQSIRPKPGVVETVRTVSETTIQQAVVSDIDTPEAHRILDTFGLRECFDHITTSEAVGHTKPDARMFTDALSALDAEPTETLMVGDRYDHDIVGATALDIDTVGYGPDASGPDTDYEIDNPRELLAILDIDE